MTQVDHVALVNGVILVVETKNYSGWIRGTANQAQWTQSLAGGRVKIKFQNPLRQNHCHLKAVETVVGTAADVVGIVVFVGAAEFPKGVPDGVVVGDGLTTFMKALQAKNGAETAKAWERLKMTVAVSDRSELKKRHAQTIKAKVV